MFPGPAEPAPGLRSVVLSLDRPATPDLARAIARVAPESWAAEHIAVAVAEVAPRRAHELASLPGVLGVYPDRPLPVPAPVAVAPKPVTPKPVTPKPLPPPPVASPTAPPPPGVGVTGQGVTVAILDTGIDGTHPDLAPAMRANVKFPPDLGRGRPVEGLANTDTTSGHGTHVAGDAAGRGTASAGRWRGMAPGAGLVGLAAGEGLVIDTGAALQAYDWMIDNKDRYGIRVVNNSFGSDTFEPYERMAPINRATRAAADAGILVVFAQGNAGDELSMNPYAAAPWVLAVGAGSNDGRAGEFSSGGIDADVMGEDFSPRAIDGETRRPGQMGLYHPAVLAPGEDIVGPRAPATVVPVLGLRRDAGGLPAGDQLRYTIASGTSMAAPEATGAAALVLEANPSLGPAEVRLVLQVTARPVPGAAFFRQGYGHIDPAAAVALAGRLPQDDLPEAARQLGALQAARDEQVLAGLARPLRTVLREDIDGPRRQAVLQPVTVSEGTARLKVASTAYGGPRPAGPFYTVAVRDAAGREVGRRARNPAQASEVVVLDLDLTGRPGLAWGEWTVEVSNGPASSLLPVNERVTLITTFAAPGPAEEPFVNLPDLPPDA